MQSNSSLPQYILELNKQLDSNSTFLELSGRACVALIFSGVENPHLLFIKRAENENDNWSGHIAFPGGKQDEEDQGDHHTTERETFEEVGLEINRNQFVGYLKAVQARKKSKLLDFAIQPLIYFNDNMEQELILDPLEVAQAYWIPLSHLLLKENHIQHQIAYNDKSMLFPAIKFPENSILWGLSYMFLTDLIERLDKINWFQEYKSQLGELAIDTKNWKVYSKY